MFEKLNPKPLLPTRVARLEELLLVKTTYTTLQPEKLANYVLNSYGFYKKQEKFPFDIWNVDNQAIMHLYRAGIKQRRQSHIQNVNHTWWRPKSGRKSSGRTGFVYKPQSAQEERTSAIKSDVTDQTDGSVNVEPLKRIQTLAESVRNDSIRPDEVQPILRDLSREMIHAIIGGSEEKSAKFLEILEQHQQATVIEGEIQSSISEPDYVEQTNRENSVLSETSAKELAEVFLNNLTDNVSVYLEDILDQLLQNNDDDDDDNDNDQSETNHDQHKK
ncbi:unnamed protein product [Schistosoma turkestanicum]|nr:unnamed protein product [Schistosoma turkestanicum]